MFLKRIKKKVRGTAESAVAYPRITLYVDLLFCIIILPRLPQSEYSITVHA